MARLTAPVRFPDKTCQPMPSFRKVAVCSLVILFFASISSFAAETNSLPPREFSHPDRIRYDSQCLTIDGKDVFIYSGAFHYFRCAKELWPDRFQKIKDAGFNCVETYVPWNYCEQQMPSDTNDFTKVNLKDLDDWLTMAESYGFYIIVRPGPYICAEWAGGGYPQWLLARKPEQPLRKEGWLRSDDPVYLAWCKHWYDAVCPVIAKHQITRQRPGAPGVILVQVENEYDSPHFPDEVKINQVKALAEDARAAGIDVPLITCWTHQVRGSDDPVLRQIFDCCNFYPRWNVEGELHSKISQLRTEQPDAPLATTELQGGWFSQVGGKLSEDQDGVTASQIQNLTLFALQMGDTIINYYMLFGGTNPDDWAARNLTTTYDYNAPIREWGGVGDRYQRVWAIGHFLQEHGVKLARSKTVECDAAVPQHDVSVAMRQAADGSRYFFIRTSQHSEGREGIAHVRPHARDTNEIVFSYRLEPFGSMILYLPAGTKDASQGEWLPEQAPAIARPHELPMPVKITMAKVRTDPGPTHWNTLPRGENLAQAGIYDSHFIFYQIQTCSPTKTNLLVKYTAGDSILTWINGKPAPGIAHKGHSSVFGLPMGSNTAEFLYENPGFANGGKEIERTGGIGLPVPGAAAENPTVASESFGRPAGDEEQWWRPGLDDENWTSVTIGDAAASSSSDPGLLWYRMNFSLPPPQPHVWVPWRLHLVARGNGFLYLNGHALGRYWDAGPQHDFFLPECWINFGNGRVNNLTLNLRPINGASFIQSATVEPYSNFAEKR